VTTGLIILRAFRFGVGLLEDALDCCDLIAVERHGHNAVIANPWNKCGNGRDSIVIIERRHDVLTDLPLDAANHGDVMRGGVFVWYLRLFFIAHASVSCA
jgi:hypothetical protein